MWVVMPADRRAEYGLFTVEIERMNCSEHGNVRSLPIAYQDNAALRQVAADLQAQGWLGALRGFERFIMTTRVRHNRAANETARRMMA